MERSFSQSNRLSPEIYRNHEALQRTHQVAPDQSDYAGDEYGNDKGNPLHLVDWNILISNI